MAAPAPADQLVPVVQDAWSDSEDVAETPAATHDVATNDASDSSEDGDTFDEKPLPRRVWAPKAEVADNVNNGLNIIFLIDASGSMREIDVATDHGSFETRISAVLRVCRGFLQQRIIEALPGSSSSALDPVMNDNFSVALFADAAHWLFQHQHAKEALDLLKQTMDDVVTPKGGTMYGAALACVDESVINDQATRIILLSDGRPGDWHQRSLNWFQFKWLKMFEQGSMELHTIGFGPNAVDFRVLQQLATLGHGLSKVSNFRITELQKTFTDISSHFTSTQLSFSGGRVVKEPRIEYMLPSAFGSMSPARESSIGDQRSLIKELNKGQWGQGHSLKL